jgi:hypothetical protein
MLSVDASNLNMVLLGDSLELFLALAELRQLNMN